LNLNDGLLERIRQTIGAEKARLIGFSNPNGLVIADRLPQGDRLIAQYFIDQILKPSSQEYSRKSVDIARRSLW
jgi:hypothetical protein